MQVEAIQFAGVLETAKLGILRGQERTSHAARHIAHSYHLPEPGLSPQVSDGADEQGAGQHHGRQMQLAFIQDSVELSRGFQEIRLNAEVAQTGDEITKEISQLGRNFDTRI